MSTPRIYASGASADLVISKVGFDASDSGLAEADKVFDSKWLFGGAIIQCGVYCIPIDGASHTIPFPEQAELPAVYAWYCQPQGVYPASGSITTSQYSFAVPSLTITTTGLVLPAVSSPPTAQFPFYMSTADRSAVSNPKYGVAAIIFGM